MRFPSIVVRIVAELQAWNSKEKLGLWFCFFFFFLRAFSKKEFMEIVRKFPEFTKASHVWREKLKSTTVPTRIATVGEFKKEGEEEQS